MEVGRTKTQPTTIILPITDNVAIIDSSVHHYGYVMLDLKVFPVTFILFSAHSIFDWYQVFALGCLCNIVQMNQPSHSWI